MNRRDFIKFLGKVTAATGLAALVGLPEVSDGILYLGRMSDEQWRSAKGEWDGMTLDHTGYKIPPGFPDDVYPLNLHNDYVLIIPGDVSGEEFIKSRFSNPLLPNTDSPCTFNGLDEYITTGHGLSS